MMKKLAAIAALSIGLGGCTSLPTWLTANPTVVAVVDGIRVGCKWEANSSDVQALLSAGIPGLSTVDNYVGAFCAAVQSLPVAAVRGAAPTPIVVAGLPVRAQRSVK